MSVKTSENVYNFAKQSINIKENENAQTKKKRRSVNNLPTDRKNVDSFSKCNIDYSKFEQCINEVEEEEEERKKEAENYDVMYNRNPCSHDHSKERQLYEKSTAEKLKASKTFNEEGKQVFYEKNYKLACIYFRKGLLQLDYCFPDTEKETIEHNELEIKLHLNMALTKFRMEKYHDCINDCNTVLNLDKNNAKAYYRKGQAYMYLDLFQESREHLLKAMQLDPNDANVKKSLLLLKNKIEMYNKRKKMVCSKIFSSEASEKNSVLKEQTYEKNERNKGEAIDQGEKHKTIQNCENVIDKEENPELTENRNNEIDVSVSHLDKPHITNTGRGSDNRKEKETEQTEQTDNKNGSNLRKRKTNDTEENMSTRNSPDILEKPFSLFLTYNLFLFFSCFLFFFFWWAFFLTPYSKILVVSFFSCLFIFYLFIYYRFIFKNK